MDVLNNSGVRPGWRHALRAAVAIVALVLAARQGKASPLLDAGHTHAAESAGAGLDRSALLQELPAAQRAWVEQTFAGLDLPHKAAQLVFVKTMPRPRAADAPDSLRLQREVEQLGIGGLVVSLAERDTVVPYLNALQQAAKVPLLVSGDFERSAGFRVDEGTVLLPGTMAIGALRNGAEDAARFAGEVTARESRALAVQWPLAPVADVNINPANPVINTRSFGEEPERVGKLVAAFIRGVHGASTPAMTAVKHFPGHGDTAVDSHLGLPVLDVDKRRLQQVELVPFKAAIAAGTDAVMIGHLAVPALDPSGAPATLSPVLNHDLLRGTLNYRGLVVTDAMDMHGAGGIWPGAAAVRAVAAGADVVLMPPDAQVAVRALVDGVRDGALSQQRLDEAVLRVLVAKARMGLDRQRITDPAAVVERVGRSDDQARADAIARDAITLLRNRDDVLPLRVERPLKLLNLVLAGEGTPDPSEPFELALQAQGIPADAQRVPLNIDAAQRDALLKALKEGGYTQVLVSLYLSQRASLDANQTSLLQALADTGVPVVAVAFGSPYQLLGLPDGIDVLIAAWGPWAPNQRAAVSALLGNSAISGRLPVSLPGLANVGAGLQLPARTLDLRDSRGDVRAAGFDPKRLRAVHDVLDAAVQKGTFPGGVVAIGHAGKLALLEPVGRLDSAANAAAVSDDSLYDLASLTKVVATTTLAMQMVDQQRLDLDAPVSRYLPGFVDAATRADDATAKKIPGKDTVSVRQLLTHSAGLEPITLMFKDLLGAHPDTADRNARQQQIRQQYLQRIEALPLAYAPGSDSRYSDLGIILLGEILERVSGQSMQQLGTQTIFQPLRMQQTLFLPQLPKQDVLARTAATEQDPWRGRLLRGEVHDENAWALGGVAPHAGLFSTVGDLARFAQMLLNGGVLDGQRIVTRATLDQFTHRDGRVVDSTRALGWDTPSDADSSAGTLFSARSFGHTGFTGTSLWIDPQRDLFVVLLTNRVNPTRNTTGIGKVRADVADAAVRALLNGDVTPRQPKQHVAPPQAPPAPSTSLPH